jgi:hypothetical protein
VAKRLGHHFTFERFRVLTPVTPDQVWVSSEALHHHVVVCLISQIRRMLSVPTTFFPHPSSPYPSRIFSLMWLKRVWKASAAHLLSGGMKDVPFPFVNALNCAFRPFLSSLSKKRLRLHKSELGKKTMLQRTGGNTRNKCKMGDYDMEKKNLTNLFYFNTCRLIHRCNGFIFFNK